MEELKQRIQTEGRVIGDSILKVDSFLNHQIEPEFILKIGRELADRFRGENITKVLTIEASGIAVAMAAGLALGVKVIFAKKGHASTQIENMYTAPVYSFTRQEYVDIFVSAKYLTSRDSVLIVDDFLAHGQALGALVNIVEQSGAHLVGAGIVIEKQFQGGGKVLREKGMRIESLAMISRMREGKIEFG